MLRTSIFMALVAMACLVRSSDAANCTATSFKQNISAIQLNASKIIAEEYCNSTKEQIVTQLIELFKEHVIYIDFTVKEDGDTINIDYKMIFACNETTDTVMPDGSTRKTETKSQVDKSQVEKAVSAGWFLQICSHSSGTLIRVSSLQVSPIEPIRSL